MDFENLIFEMSYDNFDLIGAKSIEKNWELVPCLRSYYEKDLQITMKYVTGEMLKKKY